MAVEIQVRGRPEMRLGGVGQPERLSNRSQHREEAGRR